jgi:predicted DNA-binding transcriptional regulator AlpA
MTTKCPLFEPDGYYRARQIVQPEGPVGLSPSTWWRWARQGRLPLRLGTGLVVWRGADLNCARLPRRRRDPAR